LVRLLMNLVSVAESHWTRLAVKRAVDAALPAGLTGDELEIPLGDSDRIMMWLEDAADRLEVRLTVQRLPFADAFDFVLHHPPSALLSTSAPDRSWLTATRSGWFRARFEFPDERQAWLGKRRVGGVLGIRSANEEVWVVSPTIARPYFAGEDGPEVSIGSGHATAAVGSGVGHAGVGHAGVSGHGHGASHHGGNGGGGHGGGGHGGGGHGGGHGHGMSPWRRLLFILRPESTDIGVVALFSAVVGLLALASPIAVEALVNTVAFGRFLQPVVVLSLILLTFLAFAATLRVMQAYISEIIQRRIFVRVVSDLAYRLPRVQRSAFDSLHGPELMNRFFDVMTVQKTAAMLVLDGIAMALQTVIGMLVLAFYHPYLLGFDIFLLVCLAVIVFALGRGAVRTAIEESYAKYGVAAWLEELAGSTVAFRSNGGARRAWDVADGLATEYVRARRRHFRVLIRQVVFAVGLQAVGGALLLGLGGWLVVNGQLTLGQLVAAELIVSVILGSFAKLGKQLESFYDLLAAVDKIGHLFDLPVERATGRALESDEGAAGIRAKRISFTFDAGNQVLSDVSFEIAPGEMVAITGPPGSGKSLLLDLLFGARLPTHGRIEIDGHDMRSLHLPSLRRYISLIRDREVFTGSVVDNVQLDNQSLGLNRVRAALQEVGLWEELLELPQGLDTQLNPTGQPLSDGQVRRLVLARGFALRPRVLLVDGVLDAFPSSLLPRAMEALRGLAGRCTVVIVTGRDEVANGCSRSIVLGPHAPTSAPITANH
ncbi:MAG: peptidase domain-containing ABC transporter, partial [Planctomycetota bacterium]